MSENNDIAERLPFYVGGGMQAHDRPRIEAGLSAASHVELVKRLKSSRLALFTGAAL